MPPSEKTFLPIQKWKTPKSSKLRKCSITTSRFLNTKHAHWRLLKRLNCRDDQVVLRKASDEEVLRSVGTQFLQRFGVSQLTKLVCPRRRLMVMPHSDTRTCASEIVTIFGYGSRNQKRPKSTAGLQMNLRKESTNLNHIQFDEN